MRPQPSVARDDGWVEIPAVLEMPGAEPFVLWYRLPVEHAGLLSGGADHFAIAPLFLAMKQGVAMHVHGRVSPSLLANLEEFAAVWSCWKPESYRRIAITADDESEGVPRAAGEAAGTVLAFSGGVDSAFSAWSHTGPRRSSRAETLTAGLMVHGLDIPLDGTEDFRRASARSAELLASVGLPLITVATNFRQLPGRWLDMHGAALGSCLTLLAGGFQAGMIASSWKYRLFRPGWGSNSITDPHLSSESFRMLHDGAGHGRVDKLRALAHWPEAMRLLRCCWEGRRGDVNCCRCEKCIRTYVILRALGVREPAAFPSPPDEGMIRSLRFGELTELYRETLDVAVGNGLGGEGWARALRSAFWRNRLRAILRGVRGALLWGRKRL